jgi:uncharacterized protein (TIGR03437 family)
LSRIQVLLLSNKWRRYVPLFLALLAVFGAQTVRAAVSPGLSIVSGNGQVVAEQFRTVVPMLFQARDAAGNPAPNIPITWSISQGQGTLVASDARTDGNGIGGTYFVATSLNAGLSFAPQTITASTSLGTVNFVVTTVLSRLPSGASSPMPVVQLLAPPPENSSISGKQGQTIAGAFQVQVVAAGGPQQGYPIPNVGLRLVDAQNPSGPSPASCTAMVMTNAQGIASCDATLTDAPGQYFTAAEVGEFVMTRSAVLTITPGTSCAFSLSASSISATNAGGSFSVNVGDAQSCAWTAVSNANWITITAGASGSAAGAVSFMVAPNAGIARTGTLTIAGLTLTVNQAGAGAGGPLQITTSATLPAAAAGAPYAISISVSGGTPPYTFAANGALPPGLSLNSATGLISGTPSATGSYSVGVTVTDSANGSKSQTFSLAISSSPTPGANPTITNTAFPNGTVGTAYSQLLTSIGGCSSPFSAPPVFSIAAGALPAGLTINALGDRTSVISGTPTANGTSTFTLKVTDSCGRTATAAFSMTIGGGTSGGGGGPVILLASPTQLTFTLQAGTATPSSQAVAISPQSGTPQFTAQAHAITASSYNWLNVTPGSATAPSNVTVTVSAGALPPGTYTGAIAVLPANGSGPQVNVPVTVRILPPPALTVTPTTLFFLYQQGSAPAGSQTLSVGSSGAPFDFNASTATESGGNWLFLTPVNGSTPASLTISVNPIGLAPGSYKGSVTILPAQAGIALQTVPVSLSILQNGPSITALVNAASFLSGPIAPGEIVTIFGSAMGLANGVSARLNSLGRVDTALGETRVLFDGTPAPLIYSSSGQVSAIVPYSVSGRASVQVQVEYKGALSANFAVRVTDSSPGIFTLSPNGQAAAINQDGSVNSSSTGASPGSIVAIYATGEGTTTPIPPDGAITDTTLAVPKLPVSVQVNGVDAEVVYAGSAPGLPAGALQVNVRLPDALPHGASVPVVLTIGNATSQPGVMIAVE